MSSTDRHIIWGYLQVGEIESIKLDSEYESWKNSHPHYYYRNRESNTLVRAPEDTIRGDPVITISGVGKVNIDDAFFGEVRID